MKRGSHKPEAVDAQDPMLEAEPGAEPAEARSGLPLEQPVEAARRLEEQLDELRDRHMRLAAEFDNYRKRMVRERAELGERAQAQLATRLLDVLDDMDRLMGSPAEGLTAAAQREAMELVERKLWKELREAGLERLDPTGQPFDPSVHEAVAAVPPESEAQEGTVAATFQAGYTWRGTLVRPARVQVYAGGGAA